MPALADDRDIRKFAYDFAKKGKEFSAHTLSVSIKIYPLPAVLIPESIAFNKALRTFGDFCDGFIQQEYEFTEQSAKSNAERWDFIIAASWQFQKAFGSTTATATGDKPKLPKWFLERVPQGGIADWDMKDWETQLEAFVSHWYRARSELCDLLGVLPRAPGVSHRLVWDVLMSDTDTTRGSLPEKVSFRKRTLHSTDTYTITLDRSTKSYHLTEESEGSSFAESISDSQVIEALTEVARNPLWKRIKLES